MSDTGQDRNEQLQQIIRKELKRLLTSIRVESVIVEDYDDDDSMFHVIVVYLPNDVIPETSGLVRQLQPALAGLDEDRFPVISFVAAKEAKVYFGTA